MIKRQLIVVVHGVGVREAGEATGQLSAALGHEEGPEQSSSELPWRPHSTDDFFLHEADEFSSGGLLAVFPAHLRRFRRYDPSDPTLVRQERVIADFFWGDISATGAAGVRLVVGLIKIVLGLSHAIRENAMDVFPGKTPQAIWMRRIARLAALTIHGPITALSIVLVLGLAVTLVAHTLTGAALLPDQPEVHPILTQLFLGFGTILVSWLVLRKAKVFLLRYLLSWLMAAGVLVVVVAAFQVLFPEPAINLMIFANRTVFSEVCDLGTKPDCKLAVTGFVVPGAVMVGATMLAWVVTILSAVALQIATSVKSWFPTRGNVKPIVQPAIALMTMLWMVMMVAVWAIILLINWAVQAATGFELPKGLSVDLVYAGLRLVTPAVVALIALGAVALTIHLGKAWAYRKALPSAYLAERDTLAERHRLIVGRGLLVVLTLFTAGMVAMGLWAIMVALQPEVVPAFTMWNQMFIPVMTGIVGILVLLVGLFAHRKVATGVAIFTDVLVYLNDYSWRTREVANTMRTLTERALKMQTNVGTQRQGYWLRRRIQSRMQVLMETMIRNESPDEIVIVSHSQGTVIALDVICKKGRQWLDAKPPGGILKLVTMGSPYSHIYNTYFPSAFVDVSKRAELQSVAKGGLLTDWINIFRVDDFVGTHIDTRSKLGQGNAEPGWPREHPVAPGGHINYWIDNNVIPILQKFLPFNPSD